MSDFVLPPPDVASLPIEGTSARFPVRRIYCVGRNYLAHVREMNEGADERDPPFFFQKPRDSIVDDGGKVPYPSLTKSLHHEVELVVAVGKGGAFIAKDQAFDHVFGYGVGVDLTRRDMQTVAKDKGWPWEMGKSFDRRLARSRRRALSVMTRRARSSCRSTASSGSPRRWPT